MLHRLAVLQDQDLVGAVDRVQPVGDDDPGPVHQQPVHGPLDELLGGRVQPRRRFVQDHQSGIAQEDAGEGEQLRFACRQPAAAGSQHGVQPLGQ